MRTTRVSRAACIIDAASSERAAAAKRTNRGYRITPIEPLKTVVGRPQTVTAIAIIETAPVPFVDAISLSITSAE